MAKKAPKVQQSAPFIKQEKYFNTTSIYNKTWKNDHLFVVVYSSATENTQNYSETIIATK